MLTCIRLTSKKQFTKSFTFNEYISVTKVTQIYGIYKTDFGSLYSPM